MKKMFQKTVAMAALGLMVMAGTAQADILALYPFTGNSRSSTDANANSTATDFLNGAGFLPGETDFQNAGTTPPVIRVVATATGTDPANAIDPANAFLQNDYFSFTISPNSGFRLNLDSLSLDTSSSSTTIENFFIRSSVDAFTSNLDSFSRNAATFVNSTVVLTNNAAFQNLTTSTEFRFYVFDNSNSSSQFARFDNVTLNGTSAAVTAVPEPGTVTLMLLGLIGAGSAARKRKKAEQEKAEALVSA